MNVITAPPSPSAEPLAVDPVATHRPPRVRRDLTSRATGLGALGFVGTVVLQNVIRGSSAPANDASAAEVLAHYADHRAVTAVLIATFVVGSISLAAFVGGAMRRLTAAGRPGWAYTGLVGALGITGLFAVMVGSEQALSVVAAGPDPELGAIQAIWAIHNSVFTVLLLSIATALLGLSRAGVAAGITPASFERIAPVGAALVIGTLAGPFVAAGEAMPLFGVSVLGFLVWVAFLTATGVRLIRSGEGRS